jgi:hypothetical protein
MFDCAPNTGFKQEYRMFDVDLEGVVCVMANSAVANSWQRKSRSAC